MNLTARLSKHLSLIEPLEQRIAPALLVNGANLLGGHGNPTTGQTSAGGTQVTLVKVTSGEAIVWFEGGFIDAISVGPNTTLDITGDVGTIIGNLTASGKLSDSDGNPANGLDGDVLLPNNILGITTHPLSNELGSIGAIITGGSVSNLNLSGDLGSYNVLGNGSGISGVFANLGGVYAGTGAFRPQSFAGGGTVGIGIGGLDANPILPGVQNGFSFAPSNAKTVESGASITNVKVGAADGTQMFAGNGFAGVPGSLGHPGLAGKPGGSISNVTINNAFIDLGVNSQTPSYSLLAGDGGSGSAGGAGGSIRNISEVSSTGVVNIVAGQGGSGNIAPGGAGGSITALSMQSISSAYTIHAGKGGAGSPGGAGGKVTAVNFGGNELSNGIIVSAPFTGGTANDILLIDSLTGIMVIEQNDGNGTGFTPVIQDPASLLTTISPVGSTPVGAVAVVLTGGDGLPDIVVAYKGTQDVGVYMNQGGGVFYKTKYTNGVYAGDTLQATVDALQYAPTQIAVGNFVGDSAEDLAVLSNNGGQTELETLQGDGLGGFTDLKNVLALSATPVSLVAANLPGQAFTSLFAGFKSGEVDTLLSSGSTAAEAFSVNSSITVPGGVGNLDYDAQDNLVLALNAPGNTLSVYTPNTGGTLTEATSIALAQQPGTALVAHFAPSSGVVEPIEVLSSLNGGSRLEVYNLEGSSYVLTSSTQSTEALKNFVPVAEGATSGVAAVGGEVGHFAFSQDGGAFYDVGLPFSGKNVNIVAGDGGDGMNTITDIAHGGAGGTVLGMSILAGDITVEAGNGGSGENAAAGAGGSVQNLPVLMIGGLTLPTVIEADSVLTIAAGAGGVAAGTAHGAVGGAGGSVEAMTFSMQQGDILINAGDGGNGGGGAGGNGGMVTALKSTDGGGNLIVTAGDGGDAGAVGNGGTGGSITNLTHSMSLGTYQTTEAPYYVTLTAGFGGVSTAGFGGAGGSVGNINLTLQPSNESVKNPHAPVPTGHTNIDSTLRVSVTAGNGGNGATGGAGGSVKSVTSSSVFDQVVTVIGSTAEGTSSFPEINPVTAQITAGNGGNGSKAAGGTGGSVSTLMLVGISDYDPDSADPQAGQSPMVITSGNGGNGATTGGVGGAVTGVTSENAVFIDNGVTTYPAWTELTGATVISGQGGNGGTGSGGTGGAISKLNIAVQGLVVQSPALTTSGTVPVTGGEITIQSGAGGSSAGGKGGAGGTIGTSILGSVDEAEDYGLMLQGGAGGSGALGGGAGGNVTNIQLNAPQNPMQGSTSYDALSTLIMAGNGGAATGASAVGGVGGSISLISETKDVNSSINLLQAGNGGAAVGTGGLGGSVTNVTTVGLIGQPSDDSGHTFGAFQTAVNPAVFRTLFPGGVPEGVFAGRGGTGGTSGLAGSVIDISAAQIAAIGAAVNSQGLFAAAEKIANITAEVIGYDVNGNGLYNNVTGSNRTAPSSAVAIDGFMFSETVATGIHVTDPTLLEAFTFVG